MERDRGRKKLSWIYRNKKRREAAKAPDSNAQDSVDVQNKKARIIVRNLPFQAKEDDVKKFYTRFGEVEEINLLRNPDGRLVGCGFIQFKNVPDAAKAIFKTNKTEFLGRVICSDWAIPKSKFYQKIEQASNRTNEENNESVSELDAEESKTPKDAKKAHTGDNVDVQKISIIKQNRRKLQKLRRRQKRARIVVRNLSFEASTEQLKEYFSQYGKIEDVKILTRPDGKYVGCAFVQFELVQSAAKAIHRANLQPLLGRPIIVDWAVPKNKFTKDIKEEPNNGSQLNETELKEEIIDEDEVHATVNGGPMNLKNESQVHSDDEVDEKGSVKSEDHATGSVSNENESDEESVIETEGTVSDNESETAIDSKRIKLEDVEEDEEDSRQRPRRVSNDVTEGKTVFLKNVPFSVKNIELKAYMEQFGPVYYALVCMDPLTEHSKGTAFVKFRNVADAERCLLAGTELRLQDQVLEVYKALGRNEVDDKQSINKQRNKDSRNLYLVKEGVILAGSPAAAGVSVADMSKRLQMEQWKSQILRNLNMFVSRVRLVIHNLPPSIDDNKLRQILKKHSGPKAIIKEARVMRDLKNVDGKGVGKSKEYGFVTFTTHEDALKVLRTVNNNPNIFSPHKRPIVAFSIENRIMVNAKQRRIQKSREHNPLWSGNKVKRKNDGAGDTAVSKRAKFEGTDESDLQSFTGVTGKPGAIKLRSKFNLKAQAQLHHEAVKKTKKKNKSMRTAQVQSRKQTDARKKDRVQTNQSAKKFDPEDANFSKLVDSYRNKLVTMKQTKSKWYDTT